MNLLQTLRSARYLVRLVLASFVLVVGFAAASPVLHPQGMALICSGSGAMKLVDPDGSGETQSVRFQMDCPLCAGSSALPPVPVALIVPAQQSCDLACSVFATRVAQPVGAALPARGPPAFA